MNTAVHFKAAAMSALVVVVVALIGMAFGETQPVIMTFTDKRDGKTYKKVTIGKQVWFAENLNYAAKGSVCFDNKPENCETYGRLYDWKTALTACPAGTHLPSDDEWQTLVDYVGDSATAGTKLKSKTGWERVEVEGTDDYGFSALPGGDFGDGGGDGYFLEVGSGGRWWSATEKNDRKSWYRYMSFSEKVYRYSADKTTGWFSVRCILNKKEAQK